LNRNSVIAPLVVGLSLCGLTCQQKTGAPQGTNQSATVARQGAASSQQPSAPQTQLKVGDRAPDFELTDTEGQKVRLGDFRGKKNVVLAFYVLAFTGG
jgi:peroxiredoxin Q/BCP